jgi:hypothetical protein
MTGCGGLAVVVMGQDAGCAGFAGSVELRTRLAQPCRCEKRGGGLRTGIAVCMCNDSNSPISVDALASAAAHQLTKRATICSICCCSAVSLSRSLPLCVSPHLCLPWHHHHHWCQQAAASASLWQQPGIALQNNPAQQTAAAVVGPQRCVPRWHAVQQQQSLRRRPALVLPWARALGPPCASFRWGSADDGAVAMPAATHQHTHTHRRLQSSLFQDPEIVNAFSGAVAGVCVLVRVTQPALTHPTPFQRSGATASIYPHTHLLPLLLLGVTTITQAR